MRNMRVRAKLFTGFAIVAAIGILLGIAGIVAQRMTSRYSLEIATLQASSAGASSVLNAHYTWRHSLTEAVLVGKEFTGSVDPTTCALGRWLNSEEARAITDPEVLEALRRIEAPHQFIHVEARVIAGQLEAGLLSDAEDYLTGVILPRTQEVISLLMGVEERFAVVIAEKNEEVFRLETVIEFVLLGLIVVAAIVCVFMAIYIANLLSKPLISLTAFFDKAGSKGDLSFAEGEREAFNALSRYRDELGLLTGSAMKFVEQITAVSKVLEGLSSGDLNQEADVLSDKDTIGVSLKNTLDNLNSMFGEISDSTSHVSSGSKQVADGRSHSRRARRSRPPRWRSSLLPQAR
jgi:methyl-accepting chemotaxis protein